MPNQKAPDFRYIFANTITFSMSDNDAKFVFSITEDVPENAVAQVGVAMTHRTLKLLGVIASEAAAHFERTTKTIIPFDEAKREALVEALNQSVRANSDSEAAESSSGAT